MKRLHLWLSTLHYNLVARLWKRWQRKRAPSQQEIEAAGLKAVNAMIERWKNEPLHPIGSPEWVDWAENRCAVGTGWMFDENNELIGCERTEEMTKGEFHKRYPDAEVNW
jgi:hypothetical protein